MNTEQQIFQQSQAELEEAVWDSLVAKPKMNRIKIEMSRFLEGLR